MQPQRGRGAPDPHRAGLEILKDTIDGALCLTFAPPPLPAEPGPADPPAPADAAAASATAAPAAAGDVDNVELVEGAGALPID